tara:strand:+ start:1185 stop:1334 length:150 start_codon:yes stop_codon:yes gene_type:complete
VIHIEALYLPLFINNTKNVNRKIHSGGFGVRSGAAEEGPALTAKRNLRG